MDLSSVITGSPVTEKSERLKLSNVFTLTVASAATKIDVQNALERFFGVDVQSVRVMRVRPKSRAVGADKIFTKRARGKKVLVTLAPKSKGIDLAQFRTVS